jgi:heme/copper-type cytochrome/quinol oxidase subunit 2
VATFTMQVGRTYEVRMRSLDVTHGFPGIPALGMEQRALASGAGEIIQIVRPTAAQVGTHVFPCDIECGVGHGFEGSISVVP